MEIAFSIEAVFFSLIGQNTETVTRGIHTRIIFLSICVSGAIIYWSYCAGLVSLLTIEKYEYPIKSFLVSIVPHNIVIVNLV
jgi:hypothetical protein